MKKIITFLILPLMFFVLTSCYYNTLENNEEIVLAENPTKTLLFLENEYGYGEATRFVTKTIKDGKVFIKEGKLYKEDFKYKNIIENESAVLLNNINCELFYMNDNGLQGIKYDEETIMDISYNYAQNGFGEVIKQIGTYNYVNLFNTEDNKIIDDVNNEYILYVENSIDFIEDKIQKVVVKKNIYVYSQNNEIYLYKKIQTKTIINQTNEETLSENEQNIKLISLNNIKKVIVFDGIDYSYTIILTSNNDIISVNNNTLITNQTGAFNNVLTFNRADKYLYLIDYDVIYLLDLELNVLDSYSFDYQIIGSSWFKERELSHIKIALLKDNNEIIIERIDLPKHLTDN